MTYLKGIDVSEYQSPSDWSPTGLSFVIARASIRLSPDLNYAKHVAKARAAGLVVIAYHFADNRLSIDEQVRTFLAAAGAVDGYVVDVEGAYALTRAQTRSFIGGVRKARDRCGLYMSESGFYTDVDVDWRWVANWSAKPAIPFDIWQWSNQGTALDGGRLDLDHFDTAGRFGSLANLVTGELNVNTFGTPAVPEHPETVTLKAGTKLWKDSARTTLLKTLDVDTDLPWLGKPYADAALVVLDQNPDAAGATACWIAPTDVVAKVTLTYSSPDEVAAAVAEAVAAQRAADEEKCATRVAAAKADGYTLGLADGTAQGATAEKERLAIARGAQEADAIRQL